MIEVLPPGSSALALLEIDDPADELVPGAHDVRRLDVRWLHRRGLSALGDPALMREAVGALSLPSGLGHAYVAAEAGVVRAVNRLLTESGLGPDHVSAKAYWRRGLPNAEHGEPTREA